MRLVFVFLLSVSVALTSRADPWPAESWTDAVNLTGLDSEFEQDLSGAFWNPDSRVLWVCQNGLAKVWALVEDGSGGFMVRVDGGGNRYEWDLGGQDLEDLTQVNLSQDVLYVIDESSGTILSVDLSSPSGYTLLHSWNVSAFLPAYVSGYGPEGITFVPDDWLVCRQFKDSSGNRTHSLKGMNGLIFIAHQQQGQVYVFDLNPNQNNDMLFIGQYATSRDESCAAGFDRNLGLICFWHNTGANYLELSDLTSDPLSGSIRQFRTVQELTGPRTGNLEGFAAAPQSGLNAESWCFITLDDGGADSFRWFRSFQFPDVAPPLFQNTTPEIIFVMADSVVVGVELDEPGRMYYVVLADGAANPDYMHVRGGLDATGGQPVADGYIDVPMADIEATDEIVELNAATFYDIFCVAEDQRGVLQNSVVLLEIVTAGPTETPSPGPTATPASGTPTPPVLPVENTETLSLIVVVVTGLLAGGIFKRGKS